MRRCVEELGDGLTARRLPSVFSRNRHTLTASGCGFEALLPALYPTHDFGRQYWPIKPVDIAHQVLEIALLVMGM
jgi:hypothetical protein